MIFYISTHSYLGFSGSFALYTTKSAFNVLEKSNCPFSLFVFLSLLKNFNLLYSGNFLQPHRQRRLNKIGPLTSQSITLQQHKPAYYIIMVSASKAKREAERAAKRAAGGDTPKEKKTVSSRLNTPAGGSKATSKASSVAGDATPPATSDDAIPAISKLALQEDANGISDRVTTGVLASIQSSRDVKISAVSLVFHGKVLVQDTTLELNYGRRYGLLGENGCGKSTILKSIAAREYPIPEHVDIYLLNEPADPTDLGALGWVVTEAENELKRLESLAEDILEKEGADSPLLEDLYEVSTTPP